LPALKPFIFGHSECMIKDTILKGKAVSKYII